VGDEASKSLTAVIDGVKKQPSKLGRKQINPNYVEPQKWVA
jgi:hypothetical protein